jgi:Zn-dependent peptidase ImmA (M78 family)
MLMPRTFVEEEVEAVVSRRPNAMPDQLATTLADKFQVSAEAMRYRLSRLGVLDPCALIS